jgi:quercetin dioxygenase-like cupin family protein
MSQFTDFASQPRVEVLPGIWKQALSGNHVMVTRIEYEPGASVEPHGHPAEQINIVIEGSMCWTVDDEEQAVGPGDVVVIPSNATHSARSESGAVFFEAFAPIRLEYLVGFMGRPA